MATLPCRLSCCSLGEDGSESLISSISSWADWDLGFFLLNACLKELRSCATHTHGHGGGGERLYCDLSRDASRGRVAPCTPPRRV